MSPELVAVNVVAVPTVPTFATRSPTHVKTRSALAAMLSVESIVIVIELVDVVDEVSTVPMLTPASVPVHTGVSPLDQIALYVPPAVNVIVPLLPIAVAVVAFSTICEGMRPIEVSSTSPSIKVIAVTESYDADALTMRSVLETAVAVNIVIVAGFAASSLRVLHLSTMLFWLTPYAASEKVMVIVSATIDPTVVVTALTNKIALPDCDSEHPLSAAGVAIHIDATVLVTVIVVGVMTVLASGVHDIVTLAGLVPSVPMLRT